MQRRHYTKRYKEYNFAEKLCLVLDMCRWVLVDGDGVCCLSPLLNQRVYSFIVIIARYMEGFSDTCMSRCG